MNTNDWIKHDVSAEAFHESNKLLAPIMAELAIRFPGDARRGRALSLFTAFYATLRGNGDSEAQIESFIDVAMTKCGEGYGNYKSKKEQEKNL